MSREVMMALRLQELGIPSEIARRHSTFIGRLVTSMASLCRTRPTRADLMVCVAPELICAPDAEIGVCEPVVEEGWLPDEFYSAICGLLTHIHESADPVLKPILRRELTVIENAIRIHSHMRAVREGTKTYAHFIKYLEDQVKALAEGDSILLNVGAVDHCIYLEVTRDRGAINILLYNLGELYLLGREVEHSTDGDLVAPQILILDKDFLRDRDWDRLKDIIGELILSRRRSRSIDSLEVIYRRLYELFNHSYILAAAPEVSRELAQTTGNCAWKGYAFYLHIFCLRVGIESRVLFSFLSGAAARLLVSVDKDKERQAYNLRQVAEGLVRSHVSFFNLPVCAVMEDWILADGSTAADMPGVGCGDKETVEISTKLGTAKLLLRHRPK